MYGESDGTAEKRPPRPLPILLTLALVASAAVATWLWWERASAPPAAAASGPQPLFYRHPMDPSITSPVPAKDDMGMDYMPVYAGGGDEEAGLVRISPAMANNLGVRTSPVTRGRLARRIDTVGYVGLDERRMSHVHLRVSGWIEELRVKAEGERVREGDLLFRVYSPELVNAQEEYLQAVEIGNPRLRASAAKRLRALGLSDGLISGLARRPQARELSEVYARQGGIVTELAIREGMYVQPDTRVMTLADLGSVWIMVDVFEQQAGWVAAGQRAEVRLPYLPGSAWEGEVEYVYPMLDPATRTLKVRLRFPNPDERLKPNMYADVTVFADPREGVLSVPRPALIRTGDGDRVIVARGEGRFEAVPVAAGIESGGRVEIRSGLAEGDRVVVSAQFLIDSEASVQASLLRMAEPAAIWATGTVNSVQRAPPVINLSHGPIPELGWGSMTMDFQVDRSVDLTELAPGQRVRFALAEGARGHRITAVEAGEP